MNVLRNAAVRFLVLCVVAGAAIAAEPGKASYSLAVVPQFRAEEIHRDWSPVLARLRVATGASFSLRIAADIPKFEESVLAGEPDFAYMNPYHQVMARRAQGYIPLLRDSTPLKGMLMVRTDDPIKSARELDGKEVAFPAPNAFGASLWIRALLAEREKIRIVPVYVKTHANAFRHVATGKAAAAGGIAATLAEEPEELRAALRVLLETPDVAPHPLSAHPRVPEAIRRVVVETLLAMTRDAGGQSLLKDIQLPSPVRADHARDYQPLEKYGLEKYVVRSAKP
ncbi:phosphate/phosphite/phosphonate ABC transporter substrate-binding protein [Sulfuritalea hydrogenivorans]|uniref:ABC-type phosphate/phosphonate transport system, periplasmic component n=1 Tax=Sulfuritalea hydrogenivorans sk43H TaxID=1223802 RepID=W0SEG1_9PROT|nr:phosphate/phosphite/phosphonate ABC transporter substrate-binding protein [Sulfuritalea hydrogenivorans]BAO29624.1 ABC-type phosphate/phosphonate transport system, periplasmic component [Sulfuritalea hydrogenivorans sk43H]